MFEKFKQLLFSVDSLLTGDHQIMLAQFNPETHIVDILPQGSSVVVNSALDTTGKVLVSSTTGCSDHLAHIISNPSDVLYQQSVIIDSTTNTNNLNIQLNR